MLLYIIIIHFNQSTKYNLKKLLTIVDVEHLLSNIIKAKNEYIISSK